MQTTHAQLKDIRKSFTKQLADIRREELRILSKLRNAVDDKQVQHISASIKNVDS